MSCIIANETLKWKIVLCSFKIVSEIKKKQLVILNSKLFLLSDFIYRVHRKNNTLCLLWNYSEVYNCVNNNYLLISLKKNEGEEMPLLLYHTLDFTS